LSYGHKYSEAEHEFLRSFIIGHTIKEITAEYNKRFSEPITESRVKAYMGYYKINSGRTGRFKKGNKPWNAGMKGWCPAGSENTQFKTGNTPLNTRPVGSERIDSKDGYILIKVAEPNKWVHKHRYIYEQEYGKLSKGEVVIFLDGDKTNLDIKNLKKITQKQLAVMCHQGLFSENPEITDAVSNIANLQIITNQKKKGR